MGRRVHTGQSGSQVVSSVRVSPGTISELSNLNLTLSTAGTGIVTTPENVTVTSGTGSSATTNGALVVTGGVGVSENVRVGGTIHGNLTGNVTSSGTSQFSGTTTVTGTFTFGGATVVTATTRPALGTNAIIRTNATTISENITIPAGTNGMTAGPVTIASGFTVTVNGDWSVV